jgi:hypothetical protein
MNPARELPMNFVYIIGAGASCAIDSRIPGMNLFPQLKKVLGPTRWGRLIDSLEKVGAIDANSAVTERMYCNQDGLPPHSPLSNIEIVMQHLENACANSDPDHARKAEEAFSEIKRGLVELFLQLDRDVVSKKANHAYDYFAEKLAEIDRAGHRHKHTFISFNYDIWLEQALAGHQMLDLAGYVGHRQTVYEFVFARGPSREVEKVKASVNTRIAVLKPHGSMSFLTPINAPFSEPIFLLDLENRPTFSPGSDPVDIDIPGKGAKSCESLILPPTHQKVIGGGFLLAVNKALDDALQEAHVVVVIGWSMPETDSVMRQRIFDAAYNHPHAPMHSIFKLIVCNLNPTQTFYNRFAATIPAEQHQFCKRGFGKEFVDEVMLPLWKDPRAVLGFPQGTHLSGM